MLVNLESAIEICRLLAHPRGLLVRGGSIVLVSSVMASVGSKGASVYSCSKAALGGFIRSLAVELADRSIRVNAVAPGFIRTPMFERYMLMFSEGHGSAIEKSHPLGLGNVSDVSNAIVFLISSMSRWITGTELVVDGGYSSSR
jgi:NAD(P)-dependent dehydrogenase (short-subunit alcohol dehydrogenase family)